MAQSFRPLSHDSIFCKNNQLNCFSLFRKGAFFIKRWFFYPYLLWLYVRGRSKQLVNTFSRNLGRQLAFCETLFEISDTIHKCTALCCSVKNSMLIPSIKSTVQKIPDFKVSSFEVIYEQRNSWVNAYLLFCKHVTTIGILNFQNLSPGVI